MLWDNYKKKFLILTLSNKPCNVVAQKVWEETQKYLETEDLIIIRAYNIAVEKNYLVAYTKLETLKAKIEKDKYKTTKELQAKKACQILINKKKARDAETQALERKEKLEEVAKNMSKLPKKKNPSSAEDIMSMDSDNDGHESDNELDPDLVLNQVLPNLIQEFNNKVVVLEGCFRTNGSIDVERLEQDYTLGQAHAGLRLATHLSKFMSARDCLISDPRFQEVKQSLAWTILVTAGCLTNHRNAYTNEAWQAHFQVLFKKFIKEGDYIDANKRQALNENMKTL